MQPVVLRKQTQDYAQKGSPPHQHKQNRGNGQGGEGGHPDVHQHNIEDSHCDRGDGKTKSKAFFCGSGAAPERPVYPGNQMKSISPSQKQGQCSIQIKELSAVCLCKKQDGRNEVKQQISDIKHGFADLRHSAFGFLFLFCFHVYLYSAARAAYLWFPTVVPDTLGLPADKALAGAEGASALCLHAIRQKTGTGISRRQKVLPQIT